MVDLLYIAVVFLVIALIAYVLGAAIAAALVTAMRQPGLGSGPTDKVA